MGCAGVDPKLNWRGNKAQNVPAKGAHLVRTQGQRWKWDSSAECNTGNGEILICSQAVCLVGCAWLLLSFSSFPVSNPAAPPCTTCPSVLGTRPLLPTNLCHALGLGPSCLVGTSGCASASLSDIHAPGERRTDADGGATHWRPPTGTVIHYICDAAGARSLARRARSDKSIPLHLWRNSESHGAQGYGERERLAEEQSWRRHGQKGSQVSASP